MLKHKAGQTVKHVAAKIRNLDDASIDHANIEEKHLGRKSKLHLQIRGTSTLAANFIEYIRSH